MKHSLKLKGISLKDALHIKSAEFWLILGHPMEAVAELQKLTRQAWRAAWAISVFRCAARQFGTLRQLST